MGTGNEDTRTAATTKEATPAQRRTYRLIDARWPPVWLLLGISSGLGIARISSEISPDYGPVFALALNLAALIGGFLLFFRIKHHGARVILEFAPTPPGIEVETRP